MTNPTATLADHVGSTLDVARAGARDYERLLSDDLIVLRRGLAWRAFLIVASLILLTGSATLAGVSLLLTSSIAGVDWQTRPATWAVPLGFLLASVVAALLATHAPGRPAMAGTRQRMAEDAERLDQGARVAASDIEQRLEPVRRLWKDVSSLGVVGTASAGVRGAVHDWWQQQPVRATATSIASEVRAVIDPMARRHPWWLLGGAAAAGAALVTLMPRHWLRRISSPLRTAASPWLAALGPALMAKAMAGLDLGSLVASIFKPARHGEPPAQEAAQSPTDPKAHGAPASGPS